MLGLWGSSIDSERVRRGLRDRAEAALISLAMPGSTGLTTLSVLVGKAAARVIPRKKRGRVEVLIGMLNEGGLD